jgi:hypothetical protein
MHVHGAKRRRVEVLGRTGEVWNAEPESMASHLMKRILEDGCYLGPKLSQWNAHKRDLAKYADDIVAARECLITKPTEIGTKACNNCFMELAPKVKTWTLSLRPGSVDEIAAEFRSRAQGHIESCLKSWESYLLDPASSQVAPSDVPLLSEVLVKYWPLGDDCRALLTKALEVGSRRDRRGALGELNTALDSLSLGLASKSLQVVAITEEMMTSTESVIDVAARTSVDAVPANVQKLVNQLFSMLNSKASWQGDGAHEVLYNMIQRLILFWSV